MTIVTNLQELPKARLCRVCDTEMKRNGHEVEDAALCDTAVRLKEAAVVACRPAAQQALFRELRYQADRLLANPYVAKDLETSVSIHLVVGLPYMTINYQSLLLAQY